MRFVSNGVIICFISQCNLRQIAMWLASKRSTKRLKREHQSHEMTSHMRRKRLFISICLRHEVLKNRWQTLQNAQRLAAFSFLVFLWNTRNNACRWHLFPIVLSSLLQLVRAFGHWHTIVGGLWWCRLQLWKAMRPTMRMRSWQWCGGDKSTWTVCRDNFLCPGSSPHSNCVGHWVAVRYASYTMRCRWRR